MTPTTSKRSRKRHPALLAALLAGGASALVACGGGAPDPDNSAAAPDYSAAIEAAPAPLASLYADGGVVLDGGLAAYEDQIAALEGYPIVVNKWASWCGPCRAEFPHLQNQAAEHADEVAFLGVDTDDSAAAAKTFLRDNPVPYPSISDPDKEIATSLGAIEFPSTIFYDDQGEIAYLRRGVYANEEELAADIERYALDG